VSISSRVIELVERLSTQLLVVVVVLLAGGRCIGGSVNASWLASSACRDNVSDDRALSPATHTVHGTPVIGVILLGRIAYKVRECRLLLAM